MAQTHSLTVRIPDSVYRAAKMLAEREGVSLNRLVVQALGERARQSIENCLADAYEVLGQDGAEVEVETLLGVQAEAEHREILGQVLAGPHSSLNLKETLLAMPDVGADRDLVPRRGNARAVKL